MNQILKQAQNLQKQMMKNQEELKNKEYSASAGGDMVSVKINGKLEIQKIKVAKEIVDPEDIEMLEDLLVSAVNVAIQKANEDAQSGLQGLTKGLNIPGLKF